MKKSQLTILSLLAFAAAPLGAAPQTFDFKDPKGVNNVTFTLDAPLETITGSANGISGTVTIDRENPAATKGSIVVDAATLRVPNPTMNEHMHSDKWMDTAKFGEIRFDLESVEDVKIEGDTAHATVKGKLTLRGVTKDFSAPAKVTLLPGKLAERSNGQMKGDLLVIRTEFSINRSDFGINPGAPTDKVAEEVKIRLAIAGASPKE